ncbi:helix-turn-helix transcriptional regulator, partial [Salmonella enterica]|nr:helix-turn-helix transcriptional regulator [Salmonella enterica]
MTGFDLRLWRKSQGWTQAQAALAMGCGERSWRRYEESGPPVMLERAIIS